jgi:hypothetical protein
VIFFFFYYQAAAVMQLAKWQNKHPGLGLAQTCQVSTQ